LNIHCNHRPDKPAHPGNCSIPKDLFFAPTGIRAASCVGSNRSIGSMEASRWNPQPSNRRETTHIRKGFIDRAYDSLRAGGLPQGTTSARCRWCSDVAWPAYKNPWKRFDVIVVDPRRPREAAGPACFFFHGFFICWPGNILNTNASCRCGFPGGESLSAQAVIPSINESFPYVRGFSSVEGWGFHLLASMEPIDDLTRRNWPPGCLSARKRSFGMEQFQDAPAYLGRWITNDIFNPVSLKP